MTIEIWKLSFNAEVAIGTGWKEGDSNDLYKELVRVVKQHGYLSGLMIGSSEFSIAPEGENERFTIRSS